MNSNFKAQILDVYGVDVAAAGVKILQNVHLKLFGGELCALIGPSGAGKSTLMKVLLGIRTPKKGRVTLAGRVISGEQAVGYVPQDDALHNTISVEKELFFAAELRLVSLTKAARQKKLEEVIEAVGLQERLALPISKLSGGQRKRVSIALELLTEPDLLILDEPTSGLDPGLERRMMGLFADVAVQNRVVLVATHAMESIEYCNVLCVLVRGQIAFLGRPRDALTFFRTGSYAGIFHQLEKQPPQAWARALRGFAPYQEFCRREGPALAGYKQSFTETGMPLVRGAAVQEVPVQKAPEQRKLSHEQDVSETNLGEGTAQKEGDVEKGADFLKSESLNENDEALAALKRKMGIS